MVETCFERTLKTKSNTNEERADVEQSMEVATRIRFSTLDAERSENNELEKYDHSDVLTATVVRIPVLQQSNTLVQART
jgi:hypothetical protein